MVKIGKEILGYIFIITLLFAPPILFYYTSLLNLKYSNTGLSCILGPLTIIFLLITYFIIVLTFLQLIMYISKNYDEVKNNSALSNLDIVVMIFGVFSYYILLPLVLTVATHLLILNLSNSANFEVSEGLFWGDIFAFAIFISSPHKYLKEAISNNSNLSSLTLKFKFLKSSLNKTEEDIYELVKKIGEPTERKEIQNLLTDFNKKSDMMYKTIIEIFNSTNYSREILEEISHEMNKS